MTRLLVPVMRVSDTRGGGLDGHQTPFSVTVDGFYNFADLSIIDNLGNASSKLVEAYRLHPNAIKHLARCGQGYLLCDEGLQPLAYGVFPAMRADFPLTRKSQRNVPGLRLYESFVSS